MNLEYIVKENDFYKTIKDVLISEFKISHRLLITLKKENCIYLNDCKSFVYQNIKSMDKISVLFNYVEDTSNIVPKKMDLNIVYEDECYLVINKPSGITVHPSFLHYKDSLSSGVRYYFDTINLNKKIRPVNRIDKDTSGLVIFAKNEYIQECLIRQMKDGCFCKEYVAIVEGIFGKKKRNYKCTYCKKRK